MFYRLAGFFGAGLGKQISETIFHAQRKESFVLGAQSGHVYNKNVPLLYTRSRRA